MYREMDEFNSLLTNNQQITNVVFSARDNEIFNSWVKKLHPQNAKERYWNRSKLPMREDTKELLDRFFKPFNKKLADFLGDSKWLWQQKQNQ